MTSSPSDQGDRLAAPRLAKLSSTSDPYPVVKAEALGMELARRVGLLRSLAQDAAPASSRTRVWVEGLPPTDDGAAMLLDELARG